jgi:Ca-activated chloride channel family protein
VRRVLILFFAVTLNFASIVDFNKISKATLLYNSGNYKESYSSFKELKSDTPEVNYNIANTLYKQGKYKAAIKYYKRAFGASVDEANRIYNIGNCYFLLKEYDNAIFAYKMALKLKDDEDTKANLALAYKIKNRPKKQSKKDKQKKKEGKGAKDKQNKGKKGKSSKKSTNKDKKLTKEELKMLKELEKKTKFKKELKKMLNRSLKDKKAPVLMYRIDSGNTKAKPQELKPW